MQFCLFVWIRKSLQTLTGAKILRRIFLLNTLRVTTSDPNRVTWSFGTTKSTRDVSATDLRTETIVTPADGSSSSLDLYADTNFFGNVGTKINSCRP